LEKIKTYLIIAPVTIFIIIFFIFGLCSGICESLGLISFTGKKGFTFDHYKQLLTNEVFKDSLLYTAKLALISASIALIFSIFILFILYLRKDKKSKVFSRILELPILLPYVVASYLILILFMQSGLLSRLYIYLGIIENFKEFPILTNDEMGIGIIMTYVWKSSPFIVMMSYPVLLRIEEKFNNLNHILGISKKMFFVEVVLPLLGPSLIVSFFIILAFIFTSFETPYLLGVTYPKSLAVLSYEMYSKGNLSVRPQLMAINMVISAIAILAGGIVYWINKNIISKNQRAWK